MLETLSERPLVVAFSGLTVFGASTSNVFNAVVDPVLRGLILIGSVAIVYLTIIVKYRQVKNEKKGE